MRYTNLRFTYLLTYLLFTIGISGLWNIVARQLNRIVQQLNGAYSGVITVEAEDEEAVKENRLRTWNDESVNIPQTNLRPLRRFMTKRTISMIVAVQLFTCRLFCAQVLFSRRFLPHGAHPRRASVMYITIDWHIFCLSEDTLVSPISFFTVSLFRTSAYWLSPVSVVFSRPIMQYPSTHCAQRVNQSTTLPERFIIYTEPAWNNLLHSQHIINRSINSSRGI